MSFNVNRDYRRRNNYGLPPWDHEFYPAAALSPTFVRLIRFFFVSFERYCIERHTVRRLLPSCFVSLDSLQLWRLISCSRKRKPRRSPANRSPETDGRYYRWPRGQTAGMTGSLWGICQSTCVRGKPDLLYSGLWTIFSKQKEICLDLDLYLFPDTRYDLHCTIDDKIIWYFILWMRSVIIKRHCENNRWIHRFLVLTIHDSWSERAFLCNLSNVRRHAGTLIVLQA